METYKCNVCGKVIVKLNESGIIPYCCAHKMDRVHIEFDTEPHTTQYQYENNKITIKVGESSHPMTTEHRIEWIYLKTNLGFHVKFLTLADESKACFKLCNDEEPQIIYTHCNVHGLCKVRIN